MVALGLMVVAAVIIFIGLVCGFKRGLDKSLLRLLFVIAAIVVAWIFREQITEYVLNMDVSGKTLSQTIIDGLPSEYAGFADIILPAIAAFGCVVAFLAGFLVLQFASWIVWLIVGALFRRNNARLIGGVIGAVQGAIIALALLVPLNGLILSADKIYQIEINGAQLPATEYYEYVKDYKQSELSKMLTKFGSGMYLQLSTTTDASGEKVVLDDRLNALVSASKLANEVKNITDDLSGGLSADSVDKIKKSLANIDAMKGNMTAEEKAELKKMIAAAADELNLPPEIADIDIDKVDFTKEASAVEDAYNFVTESSADLSAAAAKTVDSLLESDLLLSLADGEITVTLETDKKDAIGDYLNTLDSSVDAEKIAAIKGIFKITG